MQSLIYFIVTALAATSAEIAPEKDVFPFANKPPVIPEADARTMSPVLSNISMPVDHFNKVDMRTFNMRYYDNAQHFVRGGPIFIMLGGEREIEPGFLMGGQIYDMAADNRGYLFYLEHRYYGKSLPVQDFTSDNLRYLTIEQVLADVATFISTMKKLPDLAKSKVVVVGGSYAATLATWMRIKYPEIVDAAYASSARLKAVDDYKEYFEIVAQNIQSAYPICNKVIYLASWMLEKQFDTTESMNMLNTEINSCSPMSAGFPSKDFFFNQMANYFGDIVQYAQPGTIKAECKNLLRFNGIAIRKMVSYLRSKSNGGCFADYNSTLQWYKEKGANPRRAWLYQQCNEFGFFQTGNSFKQPFGATWFSSLYHNLCSEAIDETYTPQKIQKRIDLTNRNYGALKPNVTKVISIQGSVDPWHLLGMLEADNPEAPIILVPGSSHCADLYSVSSSDSDELRNAKLTAKKLIAKWIS